MPIELEREREAHRQQALRQVGIDARIARVTQVQVRVADLEGDILALPDFPTGALQILDPGSPFFGKVRFIAGVTPFDDPNSIILI